MRAKISGFAILAAVASVGLLGACGQEDATDDPGTGGGGTTVEPTPTPSVSAGPQSVVDESIALLAEQLGVSPDEIEVASATEVTWRDGSIGCAEKGMGYTQALVPGTRVELVVDGDTYAFHQAEGKPPFYCEHPTEP